MAPDTSLTSDAVSLVPGEDVEDAVGIRAGIFPAQVATRGCPVLNAAHNPAVRWLRVASLIHLQHSTMQVLTQLNTVPSKKT